MQKSFVHAFAFAVCAVLFGQEMEAKAEPIVLGGSGQSIVFTGDGLGGLSVTSPALTGFAVHAADPVGFYQLDPLNFTTIPHDASGNFFATPNSGLLSFLGGNGDALTATTAWEVVLANGVQPLLFGTATVTFVTGDAVFLTDFALGSTSNITLALNPLSGGIDLVTLSASQESASIMVGALDPVPVPEPQSLALFAMGLLSLAAMRRQKTAN